MTLKQIIQNVLLGGSKKAINMASVVTPNGVQVGGCECSFLNAIRLTDVIVAEAEAHGKHVDYTTTMADVSVSLEGQFFQIHITSI